MRHISFCQTCRNRLWQLEQTLSVNIDALGDDCELVLVDYGSTDGLAGWIWKNFAKFIANGQMLFFEVAGDVGWSAPRAKNLAHRLSRGDYVFNLDADNFVTQADIQSIGEARRLQQAAHQWTGSWKDGSYGRIGMPRDLFFRLGGYDETMLPMGAQDMDILKRVVALGQDLRRLPTPGRNALLNSFMDKVANVFAATEDEATAEERWNTMEAINQHLSEMRMFIEGPCRRGGYQTFKGRLNGADVIIDGLNGRHDIRA